MNRIFKLLPELEGEELVTVQSATQNMTDEEVDNFAQIYRARRKDPQMVLILSLVGLFAIPGLQRFFVNQIGLGILYLFTAGLCFIGSIVDLVTYKKLTQDYNNQVLSDVISMVRMN